MVPDRVKAFGRLLGELVLDIRRLRHRRPRSEPTVEGLDEVETARREWLLAHTYFDCVEEPELVDQAIHRILAAERRYMYLLRKAREESLSPPLSQPGT